VKPVALVIDDEPDIRELLQMTLSRMQIDSRVAADLAAAREELAQHRFDLCLTDMKLPDGSGLDLVAHIQRSHPQVPVAVITAHGSMEAAIQALKSGAFDFVSKPVDLDVLRRLISTALRLSENRADGGPRLIGESQAMRQTRATIAKLARSQAPVYISGESGVGKELVARMIHEQGPRAGQPFVPVNCGAIPHDLIESELFGHKRGSFTGAVADKPGLFQSAHGGTLFLDEVAELPLQLQVKLLRAIQEKAVRPVGSQSEVAVDARVLSATHKDLGAMVRGGDFRQDLYYRINVIELRVPPLRERREDIPPLVEHILDRLGGGDGARPALDIAAAAALPRAGHDPVRGRHHPGRRPAPAGSRRHAPRRRRSAGARTVPRSGRAPAHPRRVGKNALEPHRRRAPARDQLPCPALPAGEARPGHGQEGLIAVSVPRYVTM